METILAFAPDCPVRTLLGIPCPGCGMTRALLLCLRGDLAAAAVAHPMAPIVIAQGIVLLGLWSKVWRRRQNVARLQSALYQLAILDFAGIVFTWIVRLHTGETP